MNIHDILNLKKLNLIEASIVVHLYNVYPDKVHIDDLPGNEIMHHAYLKAINSLVRLGYVNEVDGECVFVAK